MYSLTEENYLKIIYHLSQEDVKASPTIIAERINVNPASVVDMLKKLKAKRLIQYEKSKGVKLTKSGSEIALNIIRNHRLWEVFLCDKLGYSWDVVHDIAEQLEHIKHPELAERLDAFLGHPNYDPHGDPIPKSNGEIPNIAKTLLSELDTEKICKVAVVKDTSPEFLQYLLRLSITIGTMLKIIEKITFDDSIILQIEGKSTHTVSKKFAESLLVELKS